MEIIFLDKDWNPVARERAAFAKIRGDDGTISFAFPPEPKRYHLPGEHDQCDHSVTGECVDKEKSPQRKAIFEAEARIRNKDFESGIAVKPNGEVVLDKEGDKSSVSFTLEELDKFKDTTFTHNHPSGNGFSPQDMRLAAKTDVAEMRAVAYVGGPTERRPDRLGTYYTYIMKRPEGGWPHWDEVPTIAEKMNRVVRGKYGPRIDAKTLTIEEAEASHWAAVSALYAKHIGAEFRIIRVKEKRK